MFATTLRSSFRPARDLLAAIDNVTGPERGAEEEIEPFLIYTIKNAHDQYRVALLAEMEVMPSYFVLQKGGYDTSILLEGAGALFPSDLPAKVPEAIFDVLEAGKALAFEMPTACGYHIFRAVESVLRRYYTEVTRGKAQPKIRSIGVYINAMRQIEAGDDKIISALDQLTKLHRNPLIHPEIALTADEAINLFGMARSVISVMLSALPTLDATTANPQFTS